MKEKKIEIKTITTKEVTVITKEDCNQLSDHIEGKLVVIGIDEFKDEYKDAKWQLVLATGGFGCDASKMGNAVFVIECTSDNPESYRRERFQLIGEPTEELINEWKEKYGEFNDEVLAILNKEEK